MGILLLLTRSLTRTFVNVLRGFLRQDDSKSRAVCMATTERRFENTEFFMQEVVHVDHLSLSVHTTIYVSWRIATPFLSGFGETLGYSTKLLRFGFFGFTPNNVET